VSEVGYQFRARTRGETKLTGPVAAAYLAAVTGLTLGRISSIAFARYAGIAIAGISLRLALLWTADVLAAPGPVTLLAVEAAVGAEFAAHNRYTFASLAHRGRDQLRPLFRFHLVAANSLLVQAGTAAVVQSRFAPELAALPAPALLPVAAAGLGIAVVGSYGLNLALTWPADPGRRPMPAG
jgi:putative flippase GtrA